MIDARNMECTYTMSPAEMHLRTELKIAKARILELEAMLNRPEVEDFSRGVVFEFAHQVACGRASRDAEKSPFDWFWTLGYLSQKAAQAAASGDIRKAKHHTISSAALLAQWHAHLSLCEPARDAAEGQT